jgi:hypothetical protein
MDLTRLYNLTTPELREEAERLGVGDTYAMSRGQLIHAIRNHAGGSPSEGLLGKVLGFAKWALQAAQEEPRKEDTSRPPWGEAPGSKSASVPEPVSEPASEPAPGPGPGPVFAAVPAPVPVTETASEPASGPPSRPPAGVFSKSVGMFEEPFPTRTMARILAEQGHFKRSLAIYTALLRNEPGDRELSAEVDEVRARSRARRSQAH